MPSYTIIKRLETEIRILQNYPYSPKEKILNLLEEDYEISITARTLERDLKALRKDFGLEIHFDRSQRGYLLNPNEPEQILNFLQFADRIFLGDLLRESLKEFFNLGKSVKLEDNSDFKGLQKIPLLLSAIRNKAEVSFIHENYHKQTQKYYQISPIQLREYEGRWYVVGIPQEEHHIKTFGLARLSKLKTRGLSSIKTEDYREQLREFDQIIGLNYDGAPQPQYIELAVSRSQYKYLKTLPLHPSQRFVEKLLNGWVKIYLYLIPNYELKMQLLKLGDQVEVLNPESLREEIRGILERSLSLYKKS